MASYDLAIIGGGIVGLWAARFASQAGRSVALIERGRIGDGASGGVLGALMPHQPVPWNEKKQTQFDALIELETLCRTLEGETGVPTGYRRVGRLTPITDQAQRDRQENWAQAARHNWEAGPAETFRWQVRNGADPWSVLSDDATLFGHAFDTLSAVVAPRKLLAALRASIAGTVDVYEEVQPTRWGAASCALGLSDGTIGAGQLIVAAGAQTTDVLSALGLLNEDAPAITGVKGQGALLRTREPFPRDMPLIYGDGIYLTPHTDGTLGLGSTTEKAWSEPFTTDRKLDDLIDRAVRLCPTLQDAIVLERWAHLRPKGPTANPVVERIGDRAVMASGGYKTGLAFAPSMARQALQLLEADGPVR
ncbi:NAD(P)/FAD-dependent oxidoreductase [Notoacmeibacter marinus]|uniref:NAD(P)/FAD-dependent oxidoreductase n=1 Tax=Notoacmeibacter marinus TaxID=1876515 RepID=UPI000DF4C4A6|nr:FAD-dependent oxidoreductase [Notoacmeibacter marinus]